MSNPSIYQSWRKRLNLMLCAAAAGMILSILIIGLGGFTAWQPFGTWTVFAFGGLSTAKTFMVQDLVRAEKENAPVPKGKFLLYAVMGIAAATLWVYILLRFLL